jgi:hypothetical protein
MIARSILAILLLSAASCSGDSDAVSGKVVPLPFAVQGDRLAVHEGEAFTPIFIKGVNLGVGVPGTLAGELAATREQYDRWFEQMGAMGLNSVRIYTLHYPRFYDALANYNEHHPDAPLYVLHGIWLDEEIPTQDYFSWTDMFDSGIHEVIDCVHGKNTIAERQGRAFGSYTTDISRWVLAYIIGREMQPDEVSTTNAAHGDVTSFTGKAVSLASGNPSEVWLTQRLDEVITYERARYGSERPVSVSTWPTLDPLTHPSETKTSSEDVESVDLENIDTTNAPGGFFASYHAYPYYPDFITYDAAYQDATDSAGSNSYFGYLQALKAHYGTHPLLIAEFGVPTSWGNAHYGAAGMNHGGETEAEQGQFAGRLMHDTLESNCAGGAFFAWIDEWWKRTWIVDDLAFPRDRYRLWHNITSPEQNFGLIAFEAAAPAYTQWPATTGNGRLVELRADADQMFFYVRLKLTAALGAGDTLSVGFDTYGDAIGESVLPGGRMSAHRDEFALQWSPPDPPQLYVTTAYDLFAIWHGLSTDDQLYHSVASDSGGWSTVRWMNSARDEPDGELLTRVDEVGSFQVGTADDADDKRFGVIVDGDSLTLRLPWTLLQFADPSTLTVIDDDRSTPATETAVSDGIALTVWLGDDQLSTDRFRWQGWEDAPATTERAKRSLGILSDAMKDLP